jgi:phasin
MSEQTNTNTSTAPGAEKGESAKSAKSTAGAYNAEAFNSQAAEAFDMAVPEAFRSAAERFVNQSREAYEHGKDTMEETVGMFEKSLDTAGQGAVALNRKMIEITQTNVNSGFDLARNLAGAKNLAEILECQTAFAQKQFETFATQAEEIRSLSTKVATDASTPFKEHVSRSMESLKAK